MKKLFPVKSNLWLTRVPPQPAFQRQFGWTQPQPMGVMVELSVIIPVFNEEENVRGLLENLAQQRDVSFEAIFCDGGSTDATLERVAEAASGLPFGSRIVCAGKGRGRQMNAGSRQALGTYFLFLHADCRFTDPLSLRCALDAMGRGGAGEGATVAGRFALRFDTFDVRGSFFYYFCECKARLDRRGCTHGDQGFLVSRRVFFEAGPYRETSPVLEDTRFAESVRAGWGWLLFPAELVTSARRFETEGRARRQVLNAVLMALGFLERDDLIRELPGIYSCGGAESRLGVMPFLERIGTQLARTPIRERLRFWYGVGGYACANVWQIPFAADARRSFRKGLRPGEGTRYLLSLYERCLAGVMDLRVVRAMAGLLIAGAFRLSLPIYRAVQASRGPRPDRSG